MFKIWEKTKDVPYSYFKHLETCEALEDAGKLSATFMSLPVHSGNPFVWTDVSRMRTLNSNQANKKREKHICPLQLDIIHRLINYFSMEGEVVRDVFGGIGSVGYEALKMNRKAIIIELFTQYWCDAYKYLRDVESQKNVPTLF
jgi:DNA modification methylase